MKYIANGFSFQMLSDPFGTLKFCELSEHDFLNQTVNAKSIIGHPDLASLLKLPFNRESIKLQHGDILYIVQIMGGRLPEGATKLPDDCRLKFIELKYR